MSYWRDVRGLVPKQEAISLTFGKAVHKGIELWLKGEEKYVEEAGKELDEVAVGEDKRKVRNALEKILEMYVTTYGREEYLEVEEEFEMEFGDFTLVGRMDGVMEKDGIWVVERKTTSRVDSAFFSKMRRNVQTIAYAMACKKKYGRCDGILVDGIVCTKEPSLIRGQVTIEPSSFSKFEEDARFVWWSFVQSRESNHWMQNLTNCYSWGRECVYLYLCLMGEKPSLLEQMEVR
jgi:hypothetical protein